MYIFLNMQYIKIVLVFQFLNFSFISVSIQQIMYLHYQSQLKEQHLTDLIFYQCYLRSMTFKIVKFKMNIDFTTDTNAVVAMLFLPRKSFFSHLDLTFDSSVSDFFAKFGHPSFFHLFQCSSLASMCYNKMKCIKSINKGISCGGGGCSSVCEGHMKLQMQEHKF